ncbi:MAG: tetratricopeptide repeat protein [Deltaproteobacteria bacterium]|nr:tetratricopeptide repeat protein [Deltaproteobacteria bacterium]
MKGPEHPQTRTFLNNLATVLSNLGDCADARDIFARLFSPS